VDPLNRQLRSLHPGFHALEMMRPGSSSPRKHCGGIQHKLLRHCTRKCSSLPLQSRSFSYSVCRHWDTRIGKHHQGLQTFVVASQVVSRVEPKKALALTPMSASVSLSLLSCLLQATCQAQTIDFMEFSNPRCAASYRRDFPPPDRPGPRRKTYGPCLTGRLRARVCDSRGES
jgi:hypothetical protein